MRTSYHSFPLYNLDLCAHKAVLVQDISIKIKKN